jgi:hypothetical protein
MRKLKTFISQQFRPEVLGGRLDKKHQTLFKLSKENKEPNNAIVASAICFGPKKDNVLINLEHIIKKADNIVIFYYEDIHQRWTYVNTNDESYFLYKKNDHEQYKIKPRYLYIRGCYIDPSDNHWFILGDFFNFVELWPGRVLCSPKKQMPNESKLYQLNNSLKKAARHSPAISIGQSYVIKGSRFFNSLQQNKNYIVKSLSGVRSIVVDKDDYAKWDWNNINNIPVLFQEKVAGNDLRVHLINKKTFGKRSNAKQKIDYRYDKNFFNLIDIPRVDQKLIDFSIAVSIEESNSLLGIDFIQTDSGYLVLEANPSPGWSAYHPYNGIDNEPFISELLRVLKSG